MSDGHGDGRRRNDSGDPELDDLLASFDDPRHTSDGAPVPDIALDDLLTMFDDPTAGRADADQVPGRTVPTAPAGMRWVADTTAPLDAPVPGVGDAGSGAASVGSAPGADLPVADVPVETGIDWLGAPVFSDDAAADPTIPLDPSGRGGPQRDVRPRAHVPALDDTVPAVEGVDDPTSEGEWGSAPADGDDATAGGQRPDVPGPFGETRPDGLRLAPLAERTVREVAIPVERVGVVAVDQETGELRSPTADEALPTGKAFFGRATIIIADDEGPDIGYLDDELAAPEVDTVVEAEVPELDPNTIYIGDADEALGGALERSPRNTARNGAIDPRMRARRTRVRRDADRRRIFLVAVGVGLMLMALIAVGVVASPMFGATDIRVEGAVYTDADVLAAVTADIEGDAVLLIDTDAIEVTLAEVPWVERARVETHFPHTVVIDIRERRPLACFRGGDGQWRVIDVQGRVLDVMDGQPVAYMPVSGNHPDTARGQFAGAPYAAVATLVQVLPPEVRALTTSVGLDAVTGTLTMELTGGVAVRLGSADDLDDKLARLLSQVRRGGLDGVVALDVSTAQIGVVRG
ncbi:MAG: FtsQ-type POTRA domain-containing protein [Ilumatobacteraceae bacterium]